MRGKQILFTAIISSFAVGALFYTNIVLTQSHEIGPALAAGEQALNLNACAFIPLDGVEGGATKIEGTSVAKVYYAALQLPQGSRIKRIGFWGLDNDNDGQMTLELLALLNDQDTFNLIKKVATSVIGFSSTIQLFTTSLFDYELKWNRSYVLRLTVGPESLTTPKMLEFRWARVIFEPAP